MKKYFILLILVLLFLATYLYREEIMLFYVNHFLVLNKTVTPPKATNEYVKDESFKYVSLTDNFTPHNKQDLLNIYYTIINSGQEKFSFYCPDDDSYPNCIDDVQLLANNQTVLSHINNFVHPFNGFRHIETEYDSLKKITVTIEKAYTEEKIKEINEIVDKVLADINENSTNQEKIKAVHDYIINNSKYDSDRSDSRIVKYDSDTAFGNLVQGYGLCGGYTDSMAIFLERFGLTNYKVSSENHVWNAVLLDGKWYNLDLTWDDPISTTGNDILEYTFFLIDTNELQSIENTQHYFDTTVYQELK